MAAITAYDVRCVALIFHEVAHGFSRSEKRLSAPLNSLRGLNARRNAI